MYHTFSPHDKIHFHPGSLIGIFCFIFGLESQRYSFFPHFLLNSFIKVSFLPKGESYLFNNCELDVADIYRAIGFVFCFLKTSMSLFTCNRGHRVIPYSPWISLIFLIKVKSAF